MNKVSPIQQIIDFIKEEHQKPGEPRDLNMSLLRKWCEVKLLDDEIKWHQEGSYSEEEVKQIANFGFNAGRRFELKAVDLDFTFEKWFAEFKNK